MGFEPTNGGFADLSLGPLGYRAELESITNLRNIAGAPTSRSLEYPISDQAGGGPWNQESL